MSTHIWLSKKMTPINIWKNWQRLRNSWNRTATARDQLYQMERDRQASAGWRSVVPRLNRKKHTTDPYVKTTIKRLLLDPAGVKTFEEFKALDEKVLQRRVLGEYRRKILLKAGRNMTKLFRVHPNTVRSRLLAWYYQHGYDRQDHITAWSRLNRGRDFFIKGMGTFNLEHIRAYISYCSGPIDPVEATFRGYAIKHLTSIGELGRYEHIGRYAASRLGKPIAELYSVNPDYAIKWFTTLVPIAQENALDEVRMQLMNMQRDVYIGGELVTARPAADLLDITPAQLMAERRRIYGANQRGAEQVPLSHVYEKAQHDPLVVPKVGLIRPIRTYGELQDVGKRLHNCCGSYHDEVDKGESLLLVLFALTEDNKEADPIALAEWDPADKGYSQVVETCNRTASHQIVTAYEKYQKIVLLGERNGT